MKAETRSVTVFFRLMFFILIASSPVCLCFCLILKLRDNQLIYVGYMSCLLSRHVLFRILSFISL